MSCPWHLRRVWSRGFLRKWYGSGTGPLLGPWFATILGSKHCVLSYVWYSWVCNGKPWVLSADRHASLFDVEPWVLSFLCRVRSSDHTIAAGVHDGWFGVGEFCGFVSCKSIAFSCYNRFVWRSHSSSGRKGCSLLMWYGAFDEYRECSIRGR